MIILNKVEEIVGVATVATVINRVTLNSTPPTLVYIEIHLTLSDYLNGDYATGIYGAKINFEDASTVTVSSVDVISAASVLAHNVSASANASNGEITVSIDFLGAGANYRTIADIRYYVANF